MKNPRALITLVLPFAVLLTACSSEKKLAGHMEKAETYMASGEYDKAEIELKNAIRLDPEGTDAAAMLGRIYFEQGRLALAAPILFAVGQQAPDDLDNRVNLALAYLASGRPEDAHVEALAVLENRPDDTQAPIILAESTGDAESLSETRSFLEGLENDTGSTAAIKVGLATLAFRTNELEVAEEIATEAIGLDPDFAPAYAALGTLQWARGDQDAAKASLAKAAELSTLRSARRIQYVRFLRQNGDAEAATAYLTKTIGEAPDYIPALVLAAEMAVADQNFDEASENLEKALTRDPSHPDALQLKGRLALIQNQPGQAAEIFERMLSRYPGNPQIHHQLALAYMALEEPEKAITNLKQAVSQAPDFSEAILLLAQLEIRSGGVTDAVLSLKTLVEKHPELTQAQVLLADAYRAQGNLEGALGVYQDLTERFPDSPQGHLAEGLILVQQGNQQKARVAFSKALEVAPDYMPAAEQLINLDLEESDVDAAKSRARVLVASYPDRQESHFLLARALIADGETDEAETSLLRAIAINPDARTPHMLLAGIYLQAERPEEALVHLDQVVDHNPNDVGALTLKAMVHQQTEGIEAARDTYEQIIQIDPDQVAALNNLAYIFSEIENQPDRAFELAQRTRELAPNDPYTADTLGWVVFKRGDYSWAISLLKESADRLPNEPEVLYHLGMAQYMAGQSNNAEEAFARALELSGDFPGADDAHRRVEVLALRSHAVGPETREILESLIDENPNDPVAWANLGYVLESEGQKSDAIAAYEKTLEIQPDYVEAMVGFARLQDDPRRGLEIAREAYKKAPQDPEVTATVGRLAFENGEFSWAASVLQNAARMEPEDTELAYDLARAQYSVGQLSNVSDQLGKVLKAEGGFSRIAEAEQFSELLGLADSPADAVLQIDMIQGILASDRENVPALVAHATALEYQGKTEAAEKDYRAALKIYPDFSPVKRSLALLMASDPSDLEATYRMASEAREAYPQDPNVAGALGKLAYLRKEYRRAITLLREATRAEAATAGNWFYLGMAQIKSGDAASGEASLAKAVEMGLDEGMQREAETALAGVVGGGR